MQISTCESSRNFPNMGANSNPSKPILTESEESKGGGQKPNQLGRPSLSESTTGPTRQFPSPGFESVWRVREAELANEPCPESGWVRGRRKLL